MSKIICFMKGGREERRALVAQGSAPRDFFYGVMDLQQRGYDIECLPHSIFYPGIKGIYYRILEKLFSRIVGLAIRDEYLKNIEARLLSAEVAISFTDGFSLILGRFRKRCKESHPFLVGCFHGLIDLEARAGFLMRPIVRRFIRQSLHNLDHVAFLGPADRDLSILRYGISQNKTSILVFGIDTEFWVPTLRKSEEFIFSIGQDHSRDFDTLVRAKVDYPILIHTALEIKLPKNCKNVTVSKGSYYSSSLSDEGLRDLYHRSRIVVVPLKDVYQPSGQSVALQAMSCGKAVILSSIRGLWAPELLRDGENCILVPPGDSNALANAIVKLVNDPKLCKKIGVAARNTVMKNFNLACGVASTEKLIKIGLK